MKKTKVYIEMITYDDWALCKLQSRTEAWAQVPAELAETLVSTKLEFINACQAISDYLDKHPDDDFTEEGEVNRQKHNN